MTFIPSARLRSILFSLAIMVAASVTGPSQAPAQPVIPAIDHLPRLFAEAMAARDADRLASYYGERAILMTPEGPVASGREQIRALFARNFSSGAVRMTLNQARVDGDQANAVVLWDWTLEVAVVGRDPIRRRIRSMLHLKNLSTGWQIIADMYQILPAG
jgi:uncharacterized protein (TIGR02246 family)